MMKITSKLYQLNIADFLHGLIIAVGSAVFTTIETSLQSGSLKINPTLIASVALASGISYLGKRFFTSAQVVTPINGDTTVISLSDTGVVRSDEVTKTTQSTDTVIVKSEKE
jgi:hypothetical protein